MTKPDFIAIAVDCYASDMVVQSTAQALDEVYNAGLERAAEIADGNRCAIRMTRDDDVQRWCADNIAAAIRAEKEKTDGTA
jgi:hypothetical protein